VSQGALIFITESTAAAAGKREEKAAVSQSLRLYAHRQNS
jgi:hypothetical protein